MRQLILDLIPEAPPRLDNFVAGTNADLLTGIAAWLAPDNRELSLFVWGELGAGKTHLLLASTDHYCDARVDCDLAGVDADKEQAGCRYAVDNVESLSDTGQIALFNLFNRLRAAGGRLMTAADQSPRQLKLREDLRTRLGSGLIYRVSPLTDDEKIEALAAQARARALQLTTEALNYILARAPRDMRSLSALLVALDRYSLEHKRPITLPLLRDVLNAARADEPDSFNEGEKCN